MCVIRAISVYGPISVATSSVSTTTLQTGYLFRGAAIECAIRPVHVAIVWGEEIIIFLQN